MGTEVLPQSQQGMVHALHFAMQARVSLAENRLTLAKFGNLAAEFLAKTRLTLAKFGNLAAEFLAKTRLTLAKFGNLAAEFLAENRLTLAKFGNLAAEFLAEARLTLAKFGNLAAEFLAETRIAVRDLSFEVLAKLDDRIPDPLVGPPALPAKNVGFAADDAPHKRHGPTAASDQRDDHAAHLPPVHFLLPVR